MRQQVQVTSSRYRFDCAVATGWPVWGDKLTALPVVALDAEDDTQDTQLPNVASSSSVQLTCCHPTSYNPLLCFFLWTLLITWLSIADSAILLQRIDLLPISFQVNKKPTVLELAVTYFFQNLASYFGTVGENEAPRENQLWIDIFNTVWITVRCVPNLLL